MKLFAWSSGVSLAAALWFHVRNGSSPSRAVLEQQAGILNDSNTSSSTIAATTREPRVVISNKPRRLRIRDVDYAYTDGPDYQVTGSPDQQAGVIEALALLQYNNWNIDTIAKTVEQTSVRTLKDCDAFYEKTRPLMPTPPSIDQSDDNFAALRLSRSGYSMELLRSTDPRLEHVDLNLTSFQARTLCGASTAELFATDSLFVSDFGDVARYNDPDKPEKFAANVQGFFCVDRRDQRFLPLAIHLVDSNLVYTPFDRPDEWMLAKMVLNTAEIHVQQIRHFAEIHLVFEPLRVEMTRALAADHPVYKFLNHHLYAAYGLTIIGRKLLWDDQTQYDKTFGWGATGSMRYMMDVLTDPTLSFTNSFPKDVQRRGLQHIPGHKFATYGTWIYDALDRFVDAYLRDAYASDEDVLADADLQTWALWASQLGSVLDFPSSFDSRQALKEIMVHTAFQNAVKHHMMNGQVCWEIISIPYSVPAIWKPLPLEKGAALDLDEYMMPHDRMGDLLSMVSSFSRKAPERLTLLHGYADAGFTVESQQLQDGIDTFATDMQQIEQNIDAMERDERYPVTHMRPSKLPYFAWI